MKKKYERPDVKRVGLATKDVVLTNCKAYPADPTGKNAKVCSTAACKANYGS